MLVLGCQVRTTILDGNVLTFVEKVGDAELYTIRVLMVCFPCCPSGSAIALSSSVPHYCFFRF